MSLRIQILSILAPTLVGIAGCGPSSTADVGSSGRPAPTADARPAAVAKPLLAAAIPPPVAPLSTAAQPPAIGLPALVLTDDYAAAVAEAEATGKPLLLFFTAGWCEYSRRLYDEVLPHAQLRATLASFVCVRIDVDRRPELCEQYRVRAFPTVIPASPRGTAWQRLTGAQSVESLTSGLATILSAMADRRVTGEEPLQR